MNTLQRNIVRMGSYLLAVAVLLGGCMLGGAGAAFIGAIVALVLALVGKFVWAGRPMGQLTGMGSDIVEAEHLVTRVAAQKRRSDRRVLPAPERPQPSVASEPPSRTQEGPEIVRLTRCRKCKKENRGDAYACAKCGALMRSASR